MAGTSASLVVGKRSARPTNTTLRDCTAVRGYRAGAPHAKVLVGRDRSEVDWHQAPRIVERSFRTARRAVPTIHRRVFTAFRSNWFRALLLAVAAIVTHLPALQGERIWDDHYLSLGNPFIKSPLLILE